MKILIIGAHHDDCEIGCGGTIARLTSEGHEVFGMVLTNSATHFEGKGYYRTYDEALLESQRAAEVIGLRPVMLKHELADNGRLEYSTDLMREIESFLFEKKIDQVFCHWLHDLNTDHQSAAKMAITAARHVGSVLQFRSNWYEVDRPFLGRHFIDISQHINLKIKALEQYQIEIKNRGRNWIESFVEHNKILGLKINRQYAECFEPVIYTNYYGQV